MKFRIGTPSRTCSPPAFLSMERETNMRLDGERVSVGMTKSSFLRITNNVFQCSENDLISGKQEPKKTIMSNPRRTLLPLSHKTGCNLFGGQRVSGPTGINCRIPRSQKSGTRNRPFMKKVLTSDRNILFLPHARFSSFGSFFFVRQGILFRLM